ncbi:histone deacetylase 14 isoform X2 [Micractinium conductrix]|uniref:Histone deacetylase 14 isoform X2 n=1 Tax=Micractinium conductrix TaxID=554055 RepID=A0A2P6V283_9CHLO|nr:histone deacetylase 14 isoform X2 [Micractinium conductrix]|eukprot:PSC68190.1 histone deacetylase 14 isoform X2 [Micractinium conductrix]
MTEPTGVRDLDDPDGPTYATPTSYADALAAAGAAVALLDAVVAGCSGSTSCAQEGSGGGSGAAQEDGSAAAAAAGSAQAAARAAAAGGGQAAAAAEPTVGFSVCRPPGHHATPGDQMGFCLLNNAALAARHAQRAHGLRRVLILDWDVHHGNGTQDIFVADPSVMLIDMHQQDVWPGSGGEGETGEGAGACATLNVPLPRHSGHEAAQRVWQRVVAPAARRFKPDLFVVSAGYDAHWRDPLEHLQFQSGTFHWLGGAVLALARELCDGRLLLLLEGGYNQEALGESVAETVLALLGWPSAHPLLLPEQLPHPEPLQQLLGVKKVALLFLTKIKMPHELTWRLWLEGAVGVLPHQHLAAAQEAACGSDDDAHRRLACACAPQQQQQQQQQQQVLFIVYVPRALAGIQRGHCQRWGAVLSGGACGLRPLPAFSAGVAGPCFEPDGIFIKHIIPGRVKTEWGHLSLVAASRRLLAESLNDPLNERFVLLSSSGVPLYDPLTFYQRLMGVERSHVAACYESYWLSVPIWKPAMETPLLKKEHVRKSSQWFSLTRKHAELTVADEEVYEAFKHCDCWKAGTPDEFYLATLLKAHDEVPNTHCSTPTWVQWPSTPSAHPKSFKAAEVTPQLVHSARGSCDTASELKLQVGAALPGCQLQTAHRMFSPLAVVMEGGGNCGEACHRLQGAVPANTTIEPPINPKCYVVGRKFEDDTVAAVTQLFVTRAAPQLGLLPAAASPRNRTAGGG